MPEGPLFTDKEVRSTTMPCRQSVKKAGKWDVPCVLKILCKKDKNVVALIRTKLELKKADQIYWMDHHFNGKKWVLKKFPGGGWASGNKVMILSKSTCKGAASTFYHEVWHTKQPPGMNYCIAEKDAYYNTELWTIKRNLPGQLGGSMRTKDSKGNEIPDSKAINAVVKTYPGCHGPVTSPRPIGFDAKNNKTKVRDPVTKKESWRKSKYCDSVAGSYHEKNVKTVPKSSWKCP